MKDIIKDKRIIIVALVVILLVFSTLFFLTNKRSNKNNKNNIISKETGPAELDISFLDIIGLTEVGYNRIDPETCISCTDDIIEKAMNNDYVVYDDNEIIKYFLKLNGKEIILSEMPKEDIIKLIKMASIKNNYYIKDIINDDNNDVNNYTCMKEEGSCDGIKKSDYQPEKQKN